MGRKGAERDHKPSWMDKLHALLFTRDPEIFQQAEQGRLGCEPIFRNFKIESRISQNDETKHSGISDLERRASVV